MAADAKEPGLWRAENPGQRWQVEFDGRGVLVSPEVGDWTWGLALRAYGAAGRERRLTDGARPSAVTVDGARVTYSWDESVDEWFVNDGRGVEHGYTVHRSPAGQSGRLVFELQVRGPLAPTAQADGLGVTFNSAARSAVLTYTGLVVTDADGTLLPARLTPDPASRALRITVDAAGARYPLTVDPVAQQAYLKASNTGLNDFFGHSVAVSGHTVVVGAYREDSGATGVGGNQADNSAPDAGAAYVFTRTPSGWIQEAYLKASNAEAGDFFGWSVAVSGDTIVVGAQQEDSSAVGVGGNQADDGAVNAGAAYVFVRSGGVWSQQAYVKASNTGGSDFFGYSVGVSGDTVVVGAYGEDSGATGVNGNQADNSAGSAGAAYLFTRTSGAWSQQAYLKASNAGAGDLFGASVGVSAHTVVVGAYFEASNAVGVNGNQADNSAVQAGAAYVFTQTGGGWSQQAYVKASNTGSGDQFGSSVAVSGDTVVVGAPTESSSATGVNGNQADDSVLSAGAVYVFTRTAGVWTQQAYLKASNTGAGDQFGESVSVSGDTVVVGAALEDGGATGVDGNQADDTAGGAGAAYVFGRTADVWSQQAYLKASNTGSTDTFGRSVAVAGDTVVVGAPGEDSSATGVNGNQADNTVASAGAAYVFDLGTNVIANGSFASGTAGWSTFALPDPAGMTFDVTGDVFRFYRTGAQAVVFQNTGVAMPANTPLAGQFLLGNSDGVSKRISVLVHDGDFSDLHVCTFWLPAAAPLRAYSIQTHTTKAWTNATISFYAATVGAGGFYLVDDVGLLVGAGATDATHCVDPSVPPAPGGVNGPDVIVNGDFSAGLAPWSLFGQIAGAVNGGIFEFIKLAGAPAGVVLQATGQPMAAGRIVTASLRLGNSSVVRKRVTVIVHDSSFADLSACTFWLEPGLPLTGHQLRMFTTLPWADATISVYPATVGGDQWIQLDDVVLRETPGVGVAGTECSR